MDDADGNVDLWMYDCRAEERRSFDEHGRAGRAADMVAGRAAGDLLVQARECLEVYSKAVDTTAVEQSIATPPGDKFVDQLSADGRYLSGTLLRSGLWIFPLNPRRSPGMRPRRCQG